MGHKAAVRLANLKCGSGKHSLSGAERHAKRQDKVSQDRSVGDPAQSYSWSKSGVGMAGGGCDILRAHELHKQETGAEERANAAPAMHLLAIVSPGWLLETGGPRDLENPRVMDLIHEAQLWAESWCGKGSVFHVRYDTDERGAGVVDLLVAPDRVQRHKSGTEKLVISGRKAREELLAEEQGRDPSLTNATAAMQSSWARWCQLHLDPRIERGRPKRMTQREHVHAEVYAQLKDEVREELRSSLRPEVREELMRKEVAVARRIARKACKEYRLAAARYQAAQAEAAAKATAMRKQLDAAQAGYEAITKDVEASHERLQREQAEADAQAMLLRQARAASDPHLAHLSSLMKRYAAADPENLAEAKRQALAASLAFHAGLERLLLEGRHRTGSGLMAALAVEWAKNPANPLRTPPAAVAGQPQARGQEKNDWRKNSARVAQKMAQ